MLDRKLIPRCELAVMVNMGDINLEVEYQRDVVWTGQSMVERA